MEYRKPGKTGLDISLIGLSTMTWGRQSSQADGFEQMDYALEHGINFFIQQKCMPFLPVRNVLVPVKP